MTDLATVLERSRAVCSRCGKRFRRSNLADWNVRAEGGNVVELTCMGCLTDEENAEAEINEATTDYSQVVYGIDLGGSS